MNVLILSSTTQVRSSISTGDEVPPTYSASASNRIWAARSSAGKSAQLRHRLIKCGQIAVMHFQEPLKCRDLLMIRGDQRKLGVIQIVFQPLPKTFAEPVRTLAVLRA